MAVKDTLYQKLLSHNQGVLEARKRYQHRIAASKGQSLTDNNQSSEDAPAVPEETKTASGGGSKGLETLRMLEQTLGIREEDQTKSLKDVARLT